MQGQVELINVGIFVQKGYPCMFRGISDEELLKPLPWKAEWVGESYTCVGVLRQTTWHTATHIKRLLHSLSIYGSDERLVKLLWHDYDYYLGPVDASSEQV